jgi:3',5'-cyclic-nucleotide phosphodiesterase
MDHGACNVIYTNRRAKDEHVFRESLSKSLLVQPGTGPRSQDYFGFGKPPALVKADVEQILSTFNEGMLSRRPSTGTTTALT